MGRGIGRLVKPVAKAAGSSIGRAALTGGNISAGGMAGSLIAQAGMNALRGGSGSGLKGLSQMNAIERASQPTPQRQSQMNAIQLAQRGLIAPPAPMNPKGKPSSGKNIIKAAAKANSGTRGDNAQMNSIQRASQPTPQRQSQMNAIQRASTGQVPPLAPMNPGGKPLPGKNAMGFKKGGKVKKLTCRRGDGICKRGKTRGRFI